LNCTVEEVDLLFKDLEDTTKPLDQPFREEIIKQLEFKVQLKAATAQLVAPAA
jgi:hypothetical protein